MLALTLILLAFFPAVAWAWAPATHLYFAQEVLQHAALLPDAMRALLTEYRADFLYGCLAADITLGKAFVEYIHNCHNFEVGLGLLEHARTPAERAFVYGYVSHLAADTVSHNFFVPYQNIVHYDNASYRHAYWEVRLDQFFGERVWHEVEEVVANPRTHSHDLLLDAALKDTIFSFRTNKILFSSMLAIQRLKKWQAFVQTVNKRSDMQFETAHIDEYNRLAVAAILRLLSEGKNSVVFRVDPSGKQSLEESARIRKYFRKLAKNGELTPEIHREECERFRATVRKLYFSEYPIADSHFQPSIHLSL